MVALGDSIYAGVSGAGGWVTGNRRIPDMIASRLGWQCDNQALSGAKLAGKDYIDFPQVVKRLNFKNYDVCLLEYGVNDFDWSWESLDDLREALDKGVAKIRSDNPNIQIFYQQPTGTWKHVDSLDKEDGNGWTQNDMARTLADECDVLGIAYYEWTDPIITYANTNETQGDTIHPNPDTMVKIAERLADWLASTANGLIGMYVKNITDIYNRVKKLQNSINSIFMDDSTQLDLTVKPPQIKRLNRTAYLWTIETMMHLQEVMNWVVDLCNQYGIVDVETGENTGYLTLWLPRRLSIDDIYRQKLKDDFDLCNKLLEKLNEHMKIFQ
ncbi:GDSL family lipase [Limosilactobacillus vaginalis DSM 5837 = ATCC 49540]|uniref:GDSL-like protein n=2 Tax=Limosilactobacillus vaginalis TaxID=1633 RepID=C2EWG4_9LACO|nr:GDSL-like protein [Limosilactobacillus vaginalis DSM 5837 = ATCC 49540]KRM49091.1 GDSL family lipase [Limosilactobacillus vaginalis DSM 5837 = ATCC 49540]